MSRPARRSARPSLEGLERRSLLSTVLGLTDQNSLITFDSAGPGAISGVLPISGLPAGESIVAIDIQPSTGTVFGLGSKSHLYAISLTSGAATAVSATPFSTGLVGGQFAMDDNPVTDVIRVVDDAGQNLRVSPTTGLVAGTDGGLAYASGDVNASKAPDVVALGYTDNVAGSTTTTAYAIDASTGTLDLLGSPGGSPVSPDSGQLTTVGPLGVAIGAATGAAFGFDVVGASTTAFAILSPSTGTNAGKPVLFSINLATGAATSVGLVGDGSLNVIGLAASTLVPPPAPTLATASDTGPSNTDHVTKITTPTIQGTALPDAEVWILANGTLVGRGAANSSGNYSITTSKLADGTYTIQAVQFDASGLPSGASAAMSPPLVVASATPATPSVPALLPADDTGFSNSDHFTRNNTPIFTGTGVPGATVYVFANYTLVGLATVTTAGTYSVQSSRLADGSYQVQASQIDAAGNLSLLSAGMTPTLVIDTSTRPTPQEAFIAALYVDLIGRPVDLGGLAGWQAILAGPNGRFNVLLGLTNSVGYNDQIAKTTFETLLGRAPTATELKNSENLLSSERTELYRAQIAGSPEYLQKSGGTTAGFLAKLGQDFLGQPIDAASLAKYTAQLGAGISRTSVAYEVATSVAGYTATVNGIYAELHITPDPAGLAVAVGALSKGAGDQQIIQALATTNSFFASTQGSGDVVLQWTSQLVRDFFGVAGDPTGIAATAAMLQQGTITPGQVVVSLQASAGYAQFQVKSLYQAILGRAPDSGGLAAGSAFLTSGGSIEALKALLLSSAEYFRTKGGGTVAGTLSAMYAYSIGHPIDATTLSALEGQVAAGTSLDAIALSLLFSTAGATNTAQMLYQTYLRRPATNAETTLVGGFLSTGQITDTAIVAILVTSDEYYAKL